LNLVSSKSHFMLWGFDDVESRRLWLADLQESKPELASQVHVFSSFFYKKISTKMCVGCFILEAC
jgi:hypothetical protein